jgi:hypothetical protein
MSTAVPSTALATIQRAFTDAGRLALAGFLAGYRGLTREACARDGTALFVFTEPLLLGKGSRESVLVVPTTSPRSWHLAMRP